MIFDMSSNHKKRLFGQVFIAAPDFGHSWILVFWMTINPEHWEVTHGFGRSWRRVVCLFELTFALWIW